MPRRNIDVMQDKLSPFVRSELIGWICFSGNFFPPFLYGAIPVTSNQSFELFSRLFGPPAGPTERVVPEIAQELVNMSFLSASNPSDIDLELIIETQDHAKDFRKAYREFASLVSNLKLREALEMRDAIGHVAEEMKKSAPMLDRTGDMANVALTVSVAAVTAQASNVLLSSGILSLIPGGLSGNAILQVLRKKEAREWLEGKYASFLHWFGVGPFAFAHTWRAQRIIKRHRTEST